MSTQQHDRKTYQGGFAIKGVRPEEKEIDQEAMSDILHMYRNVPAIRVARDTFLSMVLCGPFSFSIPKLQLTSDADMNRMIERYWMPWLRTAYDWLKMFGICPYYFIKPKGQDLHQVPRVPDVELGYMTVTVGDTDHELKYHWYWNHGVNAQEEETAMLWIRSEHSPAADGTIRSPLASLLERYRSLRLVQRAEDVATEQSTHPTHLLEYHPAGGGTARNDDLTQLVANFGERVAGVQMARKEAARNTEIRVRTAELLRQTRQVQQTNMANTMAVSRKVLWTDTADAMLERMDPGFATRTYPLPPDFKYVAAAKPAIVVDLDKRTSAFEMMAAASMGFSLEYIQPTGSARTQNIQGSERFENERIKEALQVFRSIAQVALIVAYRRLFEDGFDTNSRWRASRKGGDPYDIAALYPELDVQVDMSCTPMVGTDTIRNFWLDGIMEKEDYAHHAFHMNAMPPEQIKVRDWPDHVPRDLVDPKRMAANGMSAKSGGGGGGGKKKVKI